MAGPNGSRNGNGIRHAKPFGKRVHILARGEAIVRDHHCGLTSLNFYNDSILKYNI